MKLRVSNKGSIYLTALKTERDHPFYDIAKWWKKDIWFYGDYESNGTEERYFYVKKYSDFQSTNVRILEEIISVAQEHGVEIDAAVYAKMEEEKELYKQETQQKEQAAALLVEKEKKDKWEKYCKNGCTGCTNLKPGYDDHYCAATRSFLDEKNVPGYVDGTHYLFRYVAFPNEKCPYKV